VCVCVCVCVCLDNVDVIILIMGFHVYIFRRSKLTSSGDCEETRFSSAICRFISHQSNVIIHPRFCLCFVDLFITRIVFD
jgi:hypothetical protein